MFDYLVLIEMEKGMQSCIFPAKKIAKLCEAYAKDGISLDCIRAYRLVRNADPEPIRIAFDSKYCYLSLYNRYGLMIEGVNLHDN